MNQPVLLRRSLRCLALSAAAIVVNVMFPPSSVEAEPLQEGITYARRGDLELKLDVATPNEAGELRPAVICIHGGGWRRGRRQSNHTLMRELTDKGFVAITIDYRLTDVAPWPAQREDVKSAHQWLVAHAKKYGVDPERVGAIGFSAGAHLALIRGLAPGEQTEGPRLRAVVNCFGPTDIRNVGNAEQVRGLLEALVGGKLEDKKAALADASPVTHVDRTDPPVLTIQGTADRLVPPIHADWLHTALDKANVPNHLRKLEGVGHGLGNPMQRSESIKHMVDFFETYLKGPKDLPLLAVEDFDSGVDRWEPTDKTAWRAAGKSGRTWYELTKKASNYKPKVRSPLNITLLRDSEVGDFVLDVDMRSTNEPYGHQDLCLFFGHQDASHFYYVHIGRKADAHANSIFLVNDKPRVSIAKTRTEGTDWSRGWHRARIRRTAETGKIEVYFDDLTKPVMTAIDKTFVHGRIGVGSFDDTGQFDSIRLWGQRASRP